MKVPLHMTKAPALREPDDPTWGRCPHCRQSAQARIQGKLICYRCGWNEPKAVKRDEGH